MELCELIIITVLWWYWKWTSHRCQVPIQHHGFAHHFLTGMFPGLLEFLYRVLIVTRAPLSHWHPHFQARFSSFVPSCFLIKIIACKIQPVLCKLPPDTHTHLASYVIFPKLSIIQNIFGGGGLYCYFCVFEHILNMII